MRLYVCASLSVQKWLHPTVKKERILMNMISRRQFMAVAGAAAAVSVLAACGGSSSSTASSTASSASSAASSAASSEAAAEGGTVSYVALCCDTSTIDDESFNQACWTAVQNYMGENC